MFLLVNNSIRGNLQLGIVDEKKYVFQNKINIKFLKSEKLLFLIDKFLRKNKITPNKIKGLIIYPGPGSFTSLRISILFANAWAYTKKFSIYTFSEAEAKDINNNIKKILSRPASQFLIPYYGAEPNISKPKNK